MVVDSKTKRSFYSPDHYGGFVEINLLAFDSMKTQNVLVDLSGVESKAQLHSVLKNCLGFPDFYGANFYALIDCMSSFRYPEDEMTTIVLQEDEVLLMEIRNFSPEMKDLVTMIVYAVQAVNERARSRGRISSILLTF
ncbi:MAG: hypothetical protein RLZZ519_3360 [Bacteroidota bacterium]|jgi:RNAse (barnase) inhibitor barstar